MRVDEYHKMGAIKSSIEKAGKWWGTNLDKDVPTDRFDVKWGEVFIVLCAIMLLPIWFVPLAITTSIFLFRYQADRLSDKIRQFRSRMGK